MLGSIGNYTVAYMDVLGFKRKLEEYELKDLAELYEIIYGSFSSYSSSQHFKESDDPYDREYNRFRVSALKTIFPEVKRNELLCKKYIFSDSIVFISLNDEPLSITKLLICSWRFLQLAIAFGFYIRGGVAHGEMYINETGNVFLGKALKDAYELEQKQNWVGVSVDNSVVEAVPWISEKNTKLTINLFDGLLPIYDVPFKDGTFKKLRTINWIHQLVAKEGIEAMLPFVGNEDADNKIQNTLIYLKYIQDNNLHFLVADSIPYEFRPLSFGGFA